VLYCGYYELRRPKSWRGKKYLENKAPKVVENTKRTMFIKGGRTNEVVTQALKDLYVLKKPEAVMLKKRNVTRPFEDAKSIEFFSDKNDASLFVFGSHSKKRPSNLVVGRMFDFSVLDMFELGVELFKPLSYFQNSKCLAGSKPCIVFNGALFDTDEMYVRLKNVLLDFFRGAVVEKIRLSGLDRVISVTATDSGSVFLRQYRILLKKSGVKTPRVELDEIGPSFQFTIRRHQTAPAHAFKVACRVPKVVKLNVEKNVSYNAFGTKLGRVHMQRQDFSKLQTRKRKSLRETSTSKRSKTA
jgi:ribosome production factor 2